MSPERLIKIEEIFLAAVEINDFAARAMFLDEACAGDVELKKQVEKLIRQDAEAGTFLQRPIAEESAIHVFADLLDDDPLLGETVGKYKIEREIGAGGMGAVYLARRVDGSFEKRVAIKIVKRGMDTRFILRRFRQERQVLALLNHPFIAPLLDGGTTQDGLPYFVMEYVEGEPLYKYADQNNLSIAARLELFVKICSAVEYAHQNQVVHRDLKPSNILIKRDSSPRLLDFGIAKVFNPDFQGDVTVDPTQTAMRLMTPEYASPEQVKGETVSAASDIYSLGVVLYELLTGRRPYSFKNRAPHEIARVICEEEPVPPSAAEEGETRRKGEGEKDISNRITLSPQLPFSPSQLKGEIEKVILKCLRKKTDERYQTAAALAEDIKRFLNGEGVKAEAFHSTVETDETIVDAEKSIAVLPLKMMGAAGDDEYLGIGLADALISRLSKLSRFVVRPTSSVLKFQQIEPVDSLAAGRDLDVEFIVEGTIRRAGERIRVSVKLLSVAENATRWAESFDEQMTDVLEIEDSISERVAATLVPHLTGEERRRIERRGTNSPAAYEAYLRGRYFWNQFTPESLPKALAAFEKAVAIDPNYAGAYAGIADFYNWATNFGFYSPHDGNDKMRAAAARALEIDPQLPEALATMGLVKAFFDYDWTEAERLFRRSIEINPHQAVTYERYAALLSALGRTDEAGEKSALAGKLDPLSIRSVTLVAWNLYQQRRFADALARADEAIELNPRYFLGRILRGNILVELGRADEAIPEIKRGIELEPRVPLGYHMLCFALAALGRMDEARQTLHELENLPNSFASAFYLGLCSIALGESDAAFAWLDKAIDARQTLVAYLATDPKFDAVRDDERFNNLLRKTNRHSLIKRKTNPANESKTFAVLPFKILTLGAASASDENRFLGIGLADSLITRFSQVQKLVLRPTSSVLKFQGEAVDALRAGRELNAEYVLDGSVRRVGERVRVAAQLLDVRNGATVWAGNFDENFTDIFTLEDAVAGRVAAVLLPKLTGEERRKLAKHPTDSPAAYEAYLRGRYHLYQVAPTEFAKAKMYFEEAIRQDADFALAYVGLAEYSFVLTAFAPVPSAEILALGQEMSKRALEIDDSLGEVWAVYAFFSRASLEEVEQILDRSVQLSPNHSLARVYRSGLYIVQRRFDEAVAEARLAVELNPLSAFEQAHLTWILYQARRFPEAIAAGEKLIADNPHFSLGYGVFSQVLSHVGKSNEAIETARRGAALNPESPTILCSLATAHAKAGETENAREILHKLLETRQSKPFSPFDLAILHLNLGNRDSAFAELQNALLDHVPQLLWLGSEPELDPIRSDERFLKLLQMMQANRSKGKLNFLREE